MSEGPNQGNLPISRAKKQGTQFSSISTGAELIPVGKCYNALFSSVTFFQQRLSDGNASLVAI